MIAHIDGGSRGNPGPSAIGVVLEDPTHHLLLEYSRYIGETTNNQAEYLALIEALTLAKTQAVEFLTVFCDSELVVKQMNREYQCKNEKLRDLYLCACDFSARLKNFRIIHVPREKNTHADRLVNEALDRLDAKRVIG